MTQSFLLDTCACLWLVADELPENAANALSTSYQSGSASYISPITALEIATLARKRRFKSQLSPQRWFESLMRLRGVARAEMPAELMIESALLPGNIHNDPYDRIIAATAREYGYTVMTSDRALLAYAQEGYLSVFAC
jgi:PIN domain nuclease of toxin-antitoxin system